MAQISVSDVYLYLGSLSHYDFHLTEPQDVDPTQLTRELNTFAFKSFT